MKLEVLKIRPFCEIRGLRLKYGIEPVIQPMIQYSERDL